MKNPLLKEELVTPRWGRLLLAAIIFPFKPEINFVLGVINILRGRAEGKAQVVSGSLSCLSSLMVIGGVGAALLLALYRLECRGLDPSATDLVAGVCRTMFGSQ